MPDEMGVFDVMYHCRAMRRLKADPVPKDVLVSLVDAANQAPTGSNTQAMRWIVVTGSEQKKELAALNKAAVDAYLALDSPRVRVLPHQTEEQRERQRQAVLWQADHMAEIPALIIACMKFPEPVSSSAAAYGGGSVWPGVQNLLLAARALGLGAAPTTLGLSNREAARAVLGLPNNVEAFALIPVGYPMGKFGPLTRLPVGATMSWDRWGE